MSYDCRHLVETAKCTYSIVRNNTGVWMVRRGSAPYERFKEVTMPMDMSGMILVPMLGVPRVTSRIIHVRELA